MNSLPILEKAVGAITLLSEEQQNEIGRAHV